VYTEHFGFREKPFNTTPDPRFFYANAVYREAYATVLYGVRERKGFVLLTGEVGTGKTTVLRRAVAELEPGARCVLFSSPTPGFEDVLAVVCEELRVTGGESTPVTRLRRLRAWLEAEAADGRTAALLVDEAQNLDDAALEQLRLLSNLETSSEKLLQIVLVGQPELETKLDRHQLRQLRQRITVRCRLERLTTDREVAAFVDYRLAAAGYRGRPLFSPRAIARVARYSSGLPRLVNVVCDNALLATFATGATRVAPETIDEVAHDLRLGTEPLSAETVLSRRGYREALGHGAWASKRQAWMAGGVAFGLAGVGLGALASGVNPVDAFRTKEAPRLAQALAGRAAALSGVPGQVGSPAGPPPAAAVSRPEGPAEPARPEPGEPPTMPTVAPPPADAHPGDPPPHESAPRAPTAGMAAPRSDDARPEAAASIATRTGPRRAAPLVIQRGTTVAGLVEQHYGNDRLLAMDLIKELNAGIADVDLIRAGERIWLPALGRDGLVRRQANGTFHLIVASLRDHAQAGRLARALQARGYATAVRRRTLSRTLQVSRVEIVDLRDRRAAEGAVDVVRLLSPALKEPRE
jgi:type II secretory pathway predicted ATPase ExeA